MNSTSRPHATPRWTRTDWLLLSLVTLLGASLRFYQLGIVPPGFQFDEAFNAIDAAQVLHGNFPLFLPANAGREVLYTYFQAAIGWLFGLNVYTLRLASALLGTLAVPLTYLLLRRILQRQSQTVALFTSLTLAVSLWHIHFSHYGIRVISTPVLYSLLFGLYWLATQAAEPDRRIKAFAVAGILTGLSVWTHPTGRFVPFVLLAYTLWLCWQRPQQRRLALDQPVGGLLLTGVIALLVFLPLGIEFYRHPDWFVGHASEVSVFAERVSGANPWSMLGRNLLAVLGMFSFAGDVEWAHNLAGRPVFDPLLSLPFVLGVGLWLQRLWRRDPGDHDRDALVLLALWLLVMLTPSIFSEAAPNYSRTLPSLPAVFVAAGLGLSWIAERGRATVGFKRWLGPIIASGIVASSGLLAFYDYFVRFPQQPAAYYLYDADKLEALAHLNKLAEEYEIYLQPLWADHPPVRFLRRSALIKALDTADALVLPPVGKGAIYAFPEERASQAEALATYWPDAQVEVISDRYGKLMLAQVRRTAEQLTDWPPGAQPAVKLGARFAEAPTLVGMQAEPARATLTLFWDAAQGTARNLTAFVHLINADGQRIGQIDKLPANGSYETNVWSPGERVIDHYRPALSDPCAGEERVKVVVGWYELAADGARRPRQDAPGDTALAGEMILPLVAYPPDVVTLPNHLNLAVSEHATLAAAAVRAADWQASAPVVIDLFWQGDQAMAAEKISVLLVNQAGATPLWEGEIAPGVAWHEGEVLCRRLRLRLPNELTPGSYSLHVGATNAPVAFYDLTVGPSTRRFDLPTLIQSSDAVLGETIRLAGYSALSKGDPPNPLEVTLVWQAQAVPPASYTVFVHLLDANGQIVAQSDALPADGYATDRWVAGEVVTDTHRLTLPASLPPGEYRLAAGLYDVLSGQRLPGVDQAGQALVDGVAVVGAVELP